jgi:hypothetical protein
MIATGLKKFSLMAMPLTLAVIGFGLTGHMAALAQQPAASGSQDAIYVPPDRGAPRDRIGGATRGGGSDAGVVEVLAPSELGLTLSASPTLYFYCSSSNNHDVVFALINDSQTKPVSEVSLGKIAKAGIYQVSLEQLGVKLERDKTYNWSVAIVVDNSARSKDVVSSGSIKQVTRESRALEAGIPSEPELAAKLLASHGVWYDAMMKVLAKPENDAQRAVRGNLLKSVSLSDIATAELR